MPPDGAEASSRRSFGSPARKVCPASGSQIRLVPVPQPGAPQNRPSFHEKHATSLSQRDAASNAIKQLRFVPGLKRCNRVADCHGGKTFLVVVLRSNREGVTSSIPITPTIQSVRTLGFQTD